jgi:hypothetical protein
MPAPVRYYRSTAAVYDAGAADGARLKRAAPGARPLLRCGHWFDRHTRAALSALPQ